MPFTIGTRMVQFIDSSNASPDDYIEVQFESGYKVFLSTSLNGIYGLKVDQNRSDNTVLQEMYGSFLRVIERQSYWTRFKCARLRRKGLFRDKITMNVWTSSTHEGFNTFPESGKCLHVVIGHPDMFSTEVAVSSPIKSVKFF